MIIDQVQASFANQSILHFLQSL